MTHNEIAHRLAVLKGDEYVGEFDPARRYGRSLYFVPTDTLIATGPLQALHMTSEHELFGGMVPFPFVATKTITHERVWGQFQHSSISASRTRYKKCKF